MKILKREKEAEKIKNIFPPQKVEFTKNDILKISTVKEEEILVLGKLEIFLKILSVKALLCF